MPSIKSSGAPGSRDDARKALPGVSRGVRMPLPNTNDCASTFEQGVRIPLLIDANTPQIDTLDTTCYADRCAAR